MLYDLTPNMPEHRLRSLIDRFAEMQGVYGARHLINRYRALPLRSEQAPNDNREGLSRFSCPLVNRPEFDRTCIVRAE